MSIELSSFICYGAAFDMSFFGKECPWYFYTARLSYAESFKAWLEKTKYCGKFELCSVDYSKHVLYLASTVILPDSNGIIKLQPSNMSDDEDTYDEFMEFIYQFSLDLNPSWLSVAYTYREYD